MPGSHKPSPLPCGVSLGGPLQIGHPDKALVEEGDGSRHNFAYMLSCALRPGHDGWTLDSLIRMRCCGLNQN